MSAPDTDDYEVNGLKITSKPKRFRAGRRNNLGFEFAAVDPSELAPVMLPDDSDLAFHAAGNNEAAAGDDAAAAGSSAARRSAAAAAMTASGAATAPDGTPLKRNFECTASLLCSPYSS